METFLVDRTSLDEYSFVGEAGERVTVRAAQLLALIERRRSKALAALFATPCFNQRRTQVMWFSGNPAQVEPFAELADADQARLLDMLEESRAGILDLAREIDAESSSESAIYARMLPLLLNFPEPVEYHLFQVGGAPVVTSWGMNRGEALEARDTVRPFIQGWRERLALRRRQAEEEEALKAREKSFLYRLTRAGANNGQVTVSLIWNDTNDLDLHVECPNGERISFSNKQAGGGMLDVDRNAHFQALTAEPVENIVWAKKPPRGRYRAFVHHYRQHDPAIAESRFTLRLKQGETVSFQDGRVAPGGMVLVAEWQA